MPNSRGIDEFTSEQMIMLERINEHLRTLHDIEPSHLFKVQRSYDLSRLVPALEASIENRLREVGPDVLQSHINLNANQFENFFNLTIYIIRLTLIQLLTPCNGNNH